MPNFTEIAIKEFSRVIEKYNISITIDELIKRYSERHRYFHTAKHLNQIMENLASYCLSIDDYDELILITMFHDIIYIPWSEQGYSEKESANFFLNVFPIGKTYNTIRQNVYYAILNTYEHVDNTENQKLFNRLDFGFLLNTTDFAELVEYERCIFKEYQFLDIDVYIENRINFLNSIVDKNPLIGQLINYVENREYKIGIYPGSFNPWHVGHEDILNKAEKLFDKVIVVKAINPDKDATEAAKQFELLKRQLPDREVIFVEGNIITKLFANNVRNPHLIRGLRNGEDLIYEEKYLSLCKEYHSDLRYVMFLSNEENKDISSSMIRNNLLTNFIVPEYATNFIVPEYAISHNI